MVHSFTLKLLYNKLYNYEPNLALSIFNQTKSRNIMFIAVYSYYMDIIVFNTNLYLTHAKKYVKENLKLNNKVVDSILVPKNKYIQVKCNYLIGWPYNQDYTYNIIDSLPCPLVREYAYISKDEILLGHQNKAQYLNTGKIIKFALSYEEENFDKEMYFVPCN